MVSMSLLRLFIDFLRVSMRGLKDSCGFPMDFLRVS
jgi:hypothetical protein